MSRQIQEEVLAALYLIAAVLAHGEGFLILAKFLFAKAALDTGCAILLAFQDRKVPSK